MKKGITKEKVLADKEKFIKIVKESNKSKEEINNEITLQLKSIFAKVLNINEDQIKNDSNFILDLGGSSLDYFTLVVEIEKAFNIKVDVSNGLRLTVSSFVELILQSTQED